MAPPMNKSATSAGQTAEPGDENRVFWNTHPCREHQVERLKGDYEASFSRYDELRYRVRRAHSAAARRD